MNRALPQNSTVRTTWIAALLFSLILISLPWLVHLDGHPHANWEQFLGRFHPLVVHLPIGLLVLVPLLEIAGAFRPALREAASFVIALAFAGCLLALTLGVLLAHGGGEAGLGVTRHMAGAIALTIGVLLCLITRPTWFSGALAILYPTLLTCTLLTLVWTADLGGALTHGPNYLTQYEPPALKLLTFWKAKIPPTTSFYARHVNPIFDANCVACHGESKSSGGLRLDSYDFLMRGGKDGLVILAGNPEKSELLKRVTLPPDHKQFMPAEGKPPLSPEEISWIKAWIQQGASPTVATVAGVSFPDEIPDLPLQPVGNYSALLPEIQKLQKSQGAKLIPVSAKPEDGLILFTVDVSSSFGDAQLAEFQKFAPYIVEAELGRTAVTNACFDTLREFKNLRALHLEETHITGDGLNKLTSLSQLTYVNLSGTQVTPQAVAALRSMKNLRHLYLYNTPAEPTRTSQPTPSIAEAKS